MIDKEEIEMAKVRLIELKTYNRTYYGSMWFKVTTQLDDEGKKTIDTILQYISELESDNYEQNNIINNYIEIEKEHQKLNGELQKRVTYYEEICKGKSIQELGMSDLYKED